MGILLNIVENIFILANAMSFYILLGLFIAGVLKQLIPNDFISSHLGKSKISSVVKATLLGIPIPVCSCSVIPLAKSLQKEGASKGSVQSFLISTPITGVDSIMATYSFFGWVFTLYRVVTSIVIAIITGVLQNFMEKKETVTSQKSSCCTNCCSTKEQQKEPFSIQSMMQKSLYYAYYTLFKDIYMSLFLGIIIGALFTTFLPKEVLQPYFEYQFLTYLIVLLIAMPLYVCATASLPIAASFLLSGMSGGAAFVFLSAGPATNSVTMGVVAQMFGKKSLLLYIGTIATLSIVFGFLFDTFLGDLEIFNLTKESEHVSSIDTLSTLIMFGLIFYYLLTAKKR
jgi:uncharacterized membrane protein YraQ (UPF0718 family)